MINAVAKGDFTYKAFGESYAFRTPLGSLLAPKSDPETGREFPGDYEFNPYTGKKLSR